MGDTDKMCVYEGYNKARDCRLDTLVKHEVHRYLSTSEWINAAENQDEHLSSAKSQCHELLAFVGCLVFAGGGFGFLSLQLDPSVAQCFCKMIFN